MDRPRSRAPRVLAIHGGDVENLRLLRRVRMLGALVDAQIAELLRGRAARAAACAAPPSRPRAPGKRPSRMDFAVRSLMPPMIAGVVVVDLLLALAAGEHHLVGVDDDDVVAVIDMRACSVGLCLPRRRIATIVARRPTTRPLASISTHFFSMSAALAEYVLMRSIRWKWRLRSASGARASTRRGARASTHFGR